LKSAIKIFPNPNKDFIIVSLPSSVLKAVIVTYSIDGKLVKKQNIISYQQKIKAGA